MIGRIISIGSILLTVTTYVSKCQELENANIRIFDECNRTITDNFGIIASTNFSTSYPANHDCSWTVVVDEGRTIQLMFWHFEVERGTYCQNDKLSVYDGPSPDYPRLGRFCGPFKPAPQVSTSNKMHLRFVTDSTNQKRGFYASFSAEQPVAATDESCGGLLSSPTGSFQSPGYQIGNYPLSISCSWHIHVPGSRNIRLTFNDFDLEKSLGCKYDALVLEKGRTHSDGDRSVEKYCGPRDSIPEQKIYPGEELFVTFVSDASGLGRGFIAHYETEVGEERFSEATTLATTRMTSPSESTASIDLPRSTPIPTSCPRRCTKVKPKARICNANYMAAVRITQTDGLLGGNRITVDVVDTFKSDSPRPASIQLQLLCPECHKVRRPAAYLVLGDMENGVLTLHHTDYMVKYKSRKHGKVIPKWIKNCDRKRRRKRRGHNRRSNN